MRSWLPIEASIYVVVIARPARLWALNELSDRAIRSSGRFQSCDRLAVELAQNRRFLFFAKEAVQGKDSRIRNKAPVSIRQLANNRKQEPSIFTLAALNDTIFRVVFSYQCYCRFLIEFERTANNCVRNLVLNNLDKFLTRLGLRTFEPPQQRIVGMRYRTDVATNPQFVALRV